MDAIIFVCQEGLMEAQVSLLSASLKKNLCGDYKLFCAIPEQIGKVEYRTIEFLKFLGVEIRNFSNDFDPMFYLANKCLACNLEIDCDRKIFVDSDAICTGNFNFQEVPVCDLYTQVEKGNTITQDLHKNY